MFVHVALWPCTWRQTSTCMAQGGRWICWLRSAIVTVLTTTFTVLIFATFVGGLQLWTTKLPLMDVSARTTMKGAAKCDKHCELQDSVKTRIALSGYSWKHVCFNVFCVVCGACHFSVTFSCFHVSMQHSLQTHVSWCCWTCATWNIFFRKDVTNDQAALVCILKPQDMKSSQRTCWI